MPPLDSFVRLVAFHWPSASRRARGRACSIRVQASGSLSRALTTLLAVALAISGEAAANSLGQPTVTINDVTASEGSSGTTAFVFTVTLSSPTSQQVTVDFATSDGTATLANSDYRAASGTLTIPPQTAGGTITVLVNGDTTQEAAETFVVTLSNPVNASLGSPSAGTGTILNDDPPPSITIDDIKVMEGNSGKTPVMLTLHLSNPNAGPPTTVDYFTSDGSATVATNDYQAASGTVTFPAKTTSTTLALAVNGDITNEPDESFFVNLQSPTHGVVADNQGIVTISNDDDTTPPIVQVIVPNGGELFFVGAPIKLLWNTTDTNPCVVDISVSIDYGATYDPIVLGTQDDSSFFWTPSQPTSYPLPLFSALIKVVAHDCAGNTGVDTSDNPFAIWGCQPGECSAPLLLLFTANALDVGIQVRWQFADPASFTDVYLERSEDPGGPWSTPVMDRRDESGMVVAIDRSVIAGHTYFYRLTAHTRNGELVTFGPLSATAGTPITEFALNSIAPNPSRGRTRIEYSVAHASAVRLSIIDVTGREVVVLTEGISRPGRYQAIWSGETSSGRRARAGIYFVHYRSLEREFMRPLVLAP